MENGRQRKCVDPMKLSYFFGYKLEGVGVLFQNNSKFLGILGAAVLERKYPFHSMFHILLASLRFGVILEM